MADVFFLAETRTSELNTPKSLTSATLVQAPPALTTATAKEKPLLFSAPSPSQVNTVVEKVGNSSKVEKSTIETSFPGPVIEKTAHSERISSDVEMQVSSPPLPSPCQPNYACEGKNRDVDDEDESQSLPAKPFTAWETSGSEKKTENKTPPLIRVHASEEEEQSPSAEPFVVRKRSGSEDNVFSAIIPANEITVPDSFKSSRREDAESVASSSSSSSSEDAKQEGRISQHEESSDTSEYTTEEEEQKEDYMNSHSAAYLRTSEGIDTLPTRNESLVKPVPRFLRMDPNKGPTTGNPMCE